MLEKSGLNERPIASRTHIRAAVIARAIDDIECSNPGGADAAGETVETMAKAARLGSATTEEIERDIPILFGALGRTGQLNSVTYNQLSGPTQKALKAIFSSKQ